MAADPWPTPFGPPPEEAPPGDGAVATALRHVSVRAFLPDPFPEVTLALLCEAMRRSPSSSALQTRTFVVVTDPAVRRALRPHAGGQMFIETCPAFVVGCADLRRVDDTVSARAYPDRSDELRLLISSTEDVSVALQSASLAAQSLGWGTVMVGGVLNGAREIAGLLGLPPRVIPLLGLCVGRSAEPPQEVRPRLPRPVMFHRDRFSLEPDGEATLIDHHDREVVERGYYRGRRIPWSDIGGVGDDPVADEDYGWSEHVARKQARLWWDEATPKLLADLRDLGWGD